MRICPIASGSSGNCTYIGNDKTHFIVDCGISGKRIEQGLNELGIKYAELDGIFITHEHRDHIHALGILYRKSPVPIYATAGTINIIKRTDTMMDIPEEMFHVISADEVYDIGGIGVRPVSISHDAAEPVAYRFEDGDKSAAVLTDLGKFDDYIVNSMQGLNAIVLESNHDVRMLETGPYAYSLKQRILSDRGHLSNDSAGALLVRLLHSDMSAIFLGHLSKENNMAELAYETVRIEVDMSDTEYRAQDFELMIARRDVRSRCVEI